MSLNDESRAPLLAATDGRPYTPENQQCTEESALLSHNDVTPRYDGRSTADVTSSPAATSLRSLQEAQTPSKNGKTPWAVIISIATLISAAIIIAFAAFVAPAALEEYAKQAIVIEPTGLTIDSFTTNGVKARIQANVKLDASRVKDDNTRNIGKAGTWIAQKIQTEQSNVKVYLPEYDNLLLGTATVPGLVVSIRNGETNNIDFIADLVAGEVEGIKRIANDWLEGRLGQLRVQGKADITLKSGIIPLGTTSISESLVFEGNDIPTIPAYNITSLNFREIPLAEGGNGVGADVALTVWNDYPIAITIPPLGFDILISNCAADQAYLLLADATTKSLDVLPKSEVNVEVGGLVTHLINDITAPCPESQMSPLDYLLGHYIHGEDVTIYVRGSNAPSPKTPDWITDVISTFVIPVPLPGHKFDDAIKNLTLADVKFGLPNSTDPGSPDADLVVSGNIQVIAAMPKEMNFAMNVSHVRARAEVYYTGKKLGFLDLKEWQPAKSHMISSTTKTDAAIMIESQIEKAPLQITDDDLFSKMIGEYLTGGKTLTLAVKALVDINVKTVLGEFVIRDLPGEGKVPVKATNIGNFGDLIPKIGSLDIVDTSKTSLVMLASVNFSNPTPYSVMIPFASIYVENNGSIIGEAILRDVSVKPGNNTNISARAVWDPFSFGGDTGASIGRELISQYLSGYNTTLTFRTHAGSVLGYPGLGKALAKYNITIPTPRLFTPPNHPGGDLDDPDNDDPNSPPPPHFIRDATFHLFSSTATFMLLSPLQHTSIFIDHINGTALYNHTEPIGKIVYGYPFELHPGATTSPRLPVDWSLDSVGYTRVREALGGKLKLDAEAVVGVRLGHWSETVWYIGGGIGAQVRL